MIQIEPVIQRGETIKSDDGMFYQTMPDSVSHWLVKGLPDGTWTVTITVKGGIATGYQINATNEGAVS